MARKKTAEEQALEAEIAATGQSKRDLRRQAKSKAKLAKDGGKPASPEDCVQPVSDEETKESDVASSETSKKSSWHWPRWLSTAKRRAIAAGSLVVVIALVVAAGVVIRSNSTDTWDGTADISWYKEGTTSYTFWTAEQLAGLSSLCDDGVNFDGVQFALGCNIDLYDIPFKMIGSGLNDQGTTKRFAGSFNGNNHTISGINIEEDRWDHAGLFGVTDEGVIENLTVEGKVVGQMRVGGIVGEAEGTVLRNCTNRCAVSAMRTATSYYPVSADVGGVVGCWLGIVDEEPEVKEGADGETVTTLVPVELSNLVNEGEVSARACSAGGVIGTLNNTDDVDLSVSNIVNRGPVTVFCEGDERDEGAGGVIGIVNSLGEINLSGLSNEESVSCSSVYCVGGIIGSLMHEETGFAMKNCSNSGRASANASAEIAHIGGLAGYSVVGEEAFESCTNSGELAATNGNTSDLVASGQVELWDQWEEDNE